MPFGHKPQRFSKAYITKIVNQVDFVHTISRTFNWSFVCQDFRETLNGISERDFVYCDPPYVGRHVDYFNSWNEENERQLFAILNRCPCKLFYRLGIVINIEKMPSSPPCGQGLISLPKNTFITFGAREANRKPMLEALVTNFAPKHPMKTQSNDLSS